VNKQNKDVQQYSNNWLVDKNFLETKIQHSDKNYLEILFNEIKDFLYKCPSPVVSEWIQEDHGITFYLGDNEHFIKINNEIAVRDYVTLIEKWSKKFYPKYTVTYTKDRGLTSDEVAQGIKDNVFTFDESFNRKITETVVEKGMIWRVFVPDDKFTLLINGKTTIRLAGTPSNPIPLSIFLKTIRKIKDYNEKRTFIFENSLLDNDNVKEKIIDLPYTSKQLLNFFKINVDELCREELIDLGNEFFQCGKYRFTFKGNETVKDNCLSLLQYNKNFKEIKE
jgi:hypothetical protein